MKFVLVALSGLVSLCLSTANAHAGMVVNFAYMEASGTLSKNGVVDSFSVTSGAVNQALTAAQTLSLGSNGSDGKVTYLYNVGNAVSSSAGKYDISVFGSAIINAKSNQATSGLSQEAFYSFMDFTIDQDYVGTLDMSALLSATGSPNFATLNAYAFLESLSPAGTKYDLTAARTNTGGNFYTPNANFPIQINMAAGSYRMWLNMSGGREAAYNLPNLNMSGEVTLSLAPVNPVAVPEPSSMALWACVALGGSTRLRRLILRRKKDA